MHLLRKRNTSEAAINGRQNTKRGAESGGARQVREDGDEQRRLRNTTRGRVDEAVSERKKRGKGAAGRKNGADEVDCMRHKRSKSSDIGGPCRPTRAWQCGRQRREANGQDRRGQHFFAAGKSHDNEKERTVSPAVELASMSAPTRRRQGVVGKQCRCRPPFRTAVLATEST